MEKKYTTETAVEQVEGCAFRCEAGPLEMNTGYIWLRARLRTLEQENERLRKIESAAIWWAANPNETTEEDLLDLLDDDAVQQKRDEVDRCHARALLAESGED